MQWTEELKTSLKEHVSAGLTGGQIAVAMSAQHQLPFTRSMVNAATIRHGFRLSTPASRKGVKQAKAIPHPDAQPRAEPYPCTIWELNNTRCRYPLWPHELKAQTSYFYCGAPVTHKPYCEVHYLLCNNAARHPINPPRQLRSR